MNLKLINRSALSRSYTWMLTGLLASFTASTQAINIEVNMTVDNSYALFTGTETAATTFIGSDDDWRSVETYNFDLMADEFIYIVTASDTSVAQGFLGQFTNTDNQNTFYSQDSQWQVTATGLGSAAPYSSSAADIALLTEEIVNANANANASSGWVGAVSGPNNGSAPWRLRPNIDSEAKWVWHSSNGDPNPTTPGFDHDEWLIFRIAADSKPIPEPSSLAVLAVVISGLALARRRATK